MIIKRCCTRGTQDISNVHSDLGTNNHHSLWGRVGFSGFKVTVPQGSCPRPLLTLPILVFHKELCSLSSHLHLGQDLDWPGSQQLDAERFEKIVQEELFFLLYLKDLFLFQKSNMVYRSHRIIFCRFKKCFENLTCFPLGMIVVYLCFPAFSHLIEQIVFSNNSLRISSLLVYNGVSAGTAQLCPQVLSYDDLMKHRPHL